MTKKEYLKSLDKVKIDGKKVKKIEKLYTKDLPEIIQKIISCADETVFFDDDTRMLSFDEIVDAREDLHVDFTDKGIIPLADFGENDFLVYHFEDGIWSMFNIEDELAFKKKNKLEDLML